MSWIGNQYFITLRGLVEPMGETTEDITRPGADGVAFRKVGQKSNPFTMTTLVDAPTFAAAEAAIEDYKRMQGTLQSVTDDLGETHPNVLVMRVEPVRLRKILQAVGDVNPDGSTCLLECRWTLQATDLLPAAPEAP